MFRRIHWLSVAIGCFLVAGLVAMGINPMWGADHADAPLLIGAGRHDARLTDLYAFVRGEDLVLALCSNPTIPAEVAAYRFPQDLTLRFHIDNHSEVLFDDFNDLEEFGGTIVRPNKISDNIMIEVTFDRDGTALFNFEGLPRRFASRMDVFAGLRDDPFIRTPRDGKNVAAVVIALPLEAVLDSQPTLLIWGTSKVPDIGGPISEHAGRALRSQFLDGMNTVRPRDHLSMLGYVPDVMIFNTLYDAAFPNGRELTDDVVDLVVPPISLPGEDPENRENDVPFLEEFPYLPPPHPAR